MTNFVFKEFDLTSALRGAKLAWAKSFTTDGSGNFISPPDVGRYDSETNTYSNIEAYASSFSTNGNVSEGARAYIAVINNRVYYYNSEGICADNEPLHRLFIVDANITSTEDVAGSRGDTGENVEIVISSLQPREQLAMAAMKGILHNIPNPLSMTGANISDLVEMSFEIAQAMLNKAAVKRTEGNGGGTGDIGREEELPVNTEELSEGEKVLYNVNENLYKIVSQSKEQYDEIKSSGLTIKPHSTAQFKVANVDGTTLNTKVTNTVDANIKSSSITVPVAEQNVVQVTGNVNANVTNMPSEPFDVNVNNTVSIEGTVSVAGGTNEST